MYLEAPTAYLGFAPSQHTPQTAESHPDAIEACRWVRYVRTAEHFPTGPTPRVCRARLQIHTSERTVRSAVVAMYNTMHIAEAGYDSDLSLSFCNRSR